MLGGVASFHLTQDLARTVASTDRVVFLDAAPGGLQVSEVIPEDCHPVDSHLAISPAQLLGLAQRLYGVTPRAWIVRGGAAELGFGDRLSSSGLQNLQGMMSECDRLSRETLILA